MVTPARLSTGVVVGWWPVPALAVVLAVDALVAAVPVPRPVFGLLDWVAHLLTALLLLAAGTRSWPSGRPSSGAGGRGRARTAPAGLLRLGAPVLLAVLLSSVVVDLDHVPAELLGSDLLTRGTPRPYPHSVATVLLLGLAAAVVRAAGGTAPRARAAAGVLLGASLGVALHLWRDLATAPVALLWPLTDAGVEVPRTVYLLSLVVAAVLVVLPRRAARSAQ
ncbi:metal-dependent hydrolase [Aquipuribacter hungaricus]|uniref:Metal-dependent hydrolase n=1 Tax=Aquipuribacter hungaricus TaxID=545624 RepID=A0ABV7WI56_9MICO